MGLTQKLGTIPLAIQTDSSNNVGIGGAANASYKLAVTGASAFWDGTQGLNIRAYTGGSGFGAIYSTGVTAGAGNFALAASPTQTILSGVDNVSMAINSAIKLYINSSGNVLIGTTTDSTSGFNKVLTIANDYLPSLELRKIGTIGGARTYNLGVGNTGSFTIYDANAVLDRFTITNSGNVGINTSSPSEILEVKHPSNSGSTKKYVFKGYDATGNINGIALRVYDTAGGVSFADVGADYYGTGSDTNLTFSTRSGGGALAERMRIVSNGNILVGTTNEGFFNGSELGIMFSGNNGFIAASRSNTTCAFFNRFTSTGDIVQFRYAGGNVGTISTNGSTITFSGNALSDERFKENILPIENALDSINKINWVEFNYKDSKQNSAGVTAQQLETIETLSKYVINGIDVESYKAVDYNAIIGYLGKAIQELSAKVTALENKS